MKTNVNEYKGICAGEKKKKKSHDSVNLFICFKAYSI